MGQDIAKEPVDLTTDADFMDTGVLHEQRICVACEDRQAARGHAKCTLCMKAKL